MSKLREYLTESSLSRVYKHNEEHDCGTITAFRKEYTMDENLKRNKSLVHNLLGKGYGVTKISGKYVEDGVPVVEKSFFVVDYNNKGNILKDLTSLGEKFNQDSVLIIPKGTVVGNDKAYFVGTVDNGWLGLGGRKYFNGTGKFGYSDTPFVSYVNGRPFYLDKIDERDYGRPSGFNSQMLLHSVYSKCWQDLKLHEDDIDKY